MVTEGTRGGAKVQTDSWFCVMVRTINSYFLII